MGELLMTVLLVSILWMILDLLKVFFQEHREGPGTRRCVIRQAEADSVRGGLRGTLRDLFKASEAQRRSGERGQRRDLKGDLPSGLPGL